MVTGSRDFQVSFLPTITANINLPPRIPMAATDLVLALTGASGAPYGVRLLDVLLHAARTVHLTISPAAVSVIECELDRKVRLDRFQLDDLLGPRVKDDLADRIRYHHFQDFQAGIASGSFPTGGMVICPCSM